MYKRVGKADLDLDEGFEQRKQDMGERDGKKNVDMNENVGCKLPSRGLIQKKPRRKKITVWSYYHLANLETAAVCVDALDKACPMEETGCSELHATHPWHWQIKDHSGNWCNILIIQSKELERAYQDPSIEKIKISPMQKKHVTNYGSKILKLLGKGWCDADFTSMIIKSSDGSLTYNMRRLSTPSSAVSDSKHATSYEWYFLDRKKWIAMENSLEIERYFHLQATTVSMTFNHNKFEYELDFVTMICKNLNTGKEASICRRPKKREELHPSRELKLAPRTAKLPPSWEVSDTTENSLVPLNPQSEEFWELKKRMGEFVKTIDNMKIQRVQNSALFLPLKNKITEITRRTKKKPVTFRLFHWPQPDQVGAICKENFSFTLQHSGITHDYGRGTYFSRSVTTYSKQCGPEVGGSGMVFVADVLLGQYIQGDATMVVPPKMPGSRNAFDTTVDNQDNPSVYVKYTKRDYCPRYLVQFSVIH